MEKNNKIKRLNYLKTPFITVCKNTLHFTIWNTSSNFFEIKGVYISQCKKKDHKEWSFFH
jgi:hypothetical protein